MRMIPLVAAGLIGVTDVVSAQSLAEAASKAQEQHQTTPPGVRFRMPTWRAA